MQTGIHDVKLYQRDLQSAGFDVLAGYSFDIDTCIGIFRGSSPLLLTNNEADETVL